MNQMRNEAAVSESIGYIIMFTLIVTGIGLVTLYGYPELMKNQISADERNMEQNMITLQNDIKLLTYSNIPYRDTSMRISGGSLSVRNSTETGIDLSFKVDWNGGLNNYSTNCGEIRYVSDAGDAIISFSNGAVLKRYELQAGSFMIAEPRWFYDEYEGKNTLVLFFTNITSPSYMSLNGIGTIQMSSEGVVVNESLISGDVFITYFEESGNDYSVAWRNYLLSSSIYGDITETAPFSNQYKFPNVERLIIKTYTISIDNL
jgi:hypothetical protein